MITAGRTDAGGRGLFNAGATLLHIHVRDPKTGHIKNFKEYGEQIGRLPRRCSRPTGTRLSFDFTSMSPEWRMVARGHLMKVSRG